MLNGRRLQIREKMSKKNREVKQVIIIRRGLNNGRGKEIAQGSHSSMDFITKQIDGLQSKVTITKEQLQWLQTGTKKVTLQVPDEKTLMKVFQAAKQAGLVTKLVIDAGLTNAGSGKGNPTKTCISIGPNYSDEIDRITGRGGSQECKLY
jgi:PTH2 family peptidyl-tRNA hydrolase